MDIRYIFIQKNNTIKYQTGGSEHKKTIYGVNLIVGLGNIG
jgi:hypothetical protein